MKSFFTRPAAAGDYRLVGNERYWTAENAAAAMNGAWLYSVTARRAAIARDGYFLQPQTKPEITIDIGAWTEGVFTPLLVVVVPEGAESKTVWPEPLLFFDDMPVFYRVRGDGAARVDAVVTRTQYGFFNNEKSAITAHALNDVESLLLDNNFNT